MTITQGVDSDALYAFALIVKNYFKTWIHLLHSIVVLYTGWNHPRSSLGQNRRFDGIKRNIEGINLDESDNIVTDDSDKKKANDDKKPEDTPL